MLRLGIIFLKNQCFVHVIADFAANWKSPKSNQVWKIHCYFYESSVRFNRTTLMDRTNEKLFEVGVSENI